MLLEAVADHNMWFWHSFFGTPGTCNDINAWDQSPLLESMVDGTMDSLDFEFQVGTDVFSKIWFMVDGICPELSRFVKMIAVPLNHFHNNCTAWQEGAQKMAERGFGILQRKFQILCCPVEMFHMEDIADIVNACLILHDMMVEIRTQRDEPQHLSICDCVSLDEQEDCEALMFREEQGSQRRTATAMDGSTSRLSNESAETRCQGVEAPWNTNSTERQQQVKAQWEIKFEQANDGTSFAMTKSTVA